MRKLKLNMQLSLDGYAAGPNGEGDWVFATGKGDPMALQQVIEMNVEIAGSADTLLIGRKLAQSGFVDHWMNVADNQTDSPWLPFARLIANQRKIVFSHSEATFFSHHLEVEKGDLATTVQALKNEPGEDIIVFGGVEFVRSLISSNLVDEYNLLINPIALGAGQTIFGERKLLQLQSSTALLHGKVLNRYVPVE